MVVVSALTTYPRYSVIVPPSIYSTGTITANVFAILVYYAEQSYTPQSLSLNSAAVFRCGCCPILLSTLYDRVLFNFIII